MTKKIKKSVLKYTRFNPKYKYRVRYPFHVTDAPYFFTCFNSAIKHIKSKRKMKVLSKHQYPKARIFERKKNAKGLLQWKLKGYYGYSAKTGKFVKRRN